MFLRSLCARGGDGVLLAQDTQCTWLDREIAQITDRQAPTEVMYRQECGARTRKGYPCRLPSKPGRRRCKFHGGMSTGPKTEEGKARIAEAQRRRWAKHRGDQKVDNGKPNGGWRTSTTAPPKDRFWLASPISSAKKTCEKLPISSRFNQSPTFQSGLRGITDAGSVRIRGGR